MRGSESRRCSSISRPARHMMPATPPTTMAVSCLAVWEMPSASNMATGVKKPAGMADQNGQNSDMKQVAAPHQLPAAQQLAGLAAPSVLLAVEADQAADKKYREADIGIDPEQIIVDPLAHVPAPVSRFGCALFGRDIHPLQNVIDARAAIGGRIAGAKAHFGLFPGLVQRGQVAGILDLFQAQFGQDVLAWRNFRQGDQGLQNQPHSRCRDGAAFPQARPGYAPAPPDWRAPRPSSQRWTGIPGTAGM